MDSKDFWASFPSNYGETITCDYGTLVAALGKPEGYCDPDKVQVEWTIDTPGGVINIYDWKEYGRDVRDGQPVEWHIGRFGDSDIDKIAEFLEAKGLKVDMY